MKKNSLALFNTGKNQIQRNISADSTTTAVRKVFSSGMEIFVGVKIPNHAKKADYKQVLMELNKLGINQRVSAFLTGMSPTYVSKLLKK